MLNGEISEMQEEGVLVYYHHPCRITKKTMNIPLKIADNQPTLKTHTSHIQGTLGITKLTCLASSK